MAQAFPFPGMRFLLRVLLNFAADGDSNAAGRRSSARPPKETASRCARDSMCRSANAQNTLGTKMRKNSRGAARPFAQIGRVQMGRSGRAAGLKPNSIRHSGGTRSVNPGNLEISGFTLRVPRGMTHGERKNGKNWAERIVRPRGCAALFTSLEDFPPRRHTAPCPKRAD